jgi:trans-2,3-dihydro-3-hydroxyanthranilate isomerase
MKNRTGSATAATIARLAQLRPSVADRRWRVHQGVDMGRPSLLLGRTTLRNGDLESVHVGGTCVAVMEGTFTLVGDD